MPANYEDHVYSTETFNALETTPEHWKIYEAAIRVEQHAALFSGSEVVASKTVDDANALAKRLLRDAHASAPGTDAFDTGDLVATGDTRAIVLGFAEDDYVIVCELPSAADADESYWPQADARLLARARHIDADGLPRLLSLWVERSSGGGGECRVAEVDVFGYVCTCTGSRIPLDRWFRDFRPVDMSPAATKSNSALALDLVYSVGGGQAIPCRDPRTMAQAHDPNARGWAAQWMGAFYWRGPRHSTGATVASEALRGTMAEAHEWTKRCDGTVVWVGEAAGANPPPTESTAKRDVAPTPAPRPGQTWRSRTSGLTGVIVDDAGAPHYYTCRCENGARYDAESSFFAERADYVSGPTEPETPREALERVIRLEAELPPDGVTPTEWMRLLLSMAEERNGKPAELAKFREQVAHFRSNGDVPEIDTWATEMRAAFRRGGHAKERAAKDADFHRYAREAYAANAEAEKRP